VWGEVWDSPAADACSARADRLMASPGAPGHRRPWRLRPRDSSGPYPHLPGHRIRPPRPRIDRGARRPRRSIRSSNTILRLSSPGPPRPIPWATGSPGGSRRTPIASPTPRTPRRLRPPGTHAPPPLPRRRRPHAGLRSAVVAIGRAPAETPCPADGARGKATSAPGRPPSRLTRPGEPRWRRCAPPAPPARPWPRGW
jgi:hypothetical protein